MNNVVSHYEKSDEDSRLTTNNARKIEFIVTTTVLDKYIQKQGKLLDLGAGTGIYSFYFAEKGNDVLAMDITPKHIEIIKQKLKKCVNGIRLSAEVGDAVDLNKYQSGSFDAVLCFGPMYHLLDECHRERCIGEALRVLKKGGILAIAYINKHFVLHSVMLRDKNYLADNFVDKILNTGIIREGEKECFWTDAYFTIPSEMEALATKFGTEIIDHVGTDGLSPFLKNFLDNMTEKEYASWLYYTLSSCRDKSILGMSNHGLLICKK
jgi:ubiquinone/menaquinone biosynthesis C-methylase UbiE